MGKIISYVAIFLMLIGLIYAQTSGGTNCQEYYTCPDGSKVEYCEIVENYDDSGNLIGAGCGCKSSPQTQCPTVTPVSSGGEEGGQGGISPISGELKDKYEFIGKIGGDEKGTSNYKFNNPNDVALDSSEKIYVADSDNDRIMIYDSDFEFVRTFDADINEPRYIYIDNEDNVYIIDEGKESRGRVRKFDRQENEILALSQPDMPQEFAEEHGLIGLIEFYPNGLAVDSKGKIFVSEENVGNAEFNRIHIYNSDGSFDKHFKDSRFNRPRELVFDRSDNLYVNDYMNDGIIVYDDNLNYISSIDDQGFHQPAGIDFDSEGLFYIVDKMNQRVQVFDENLKYFATIAGNGAGNEDNQLYFPSGIDIGDDGKVYITNHMSHRVSIFKKKVGDIEGESEQSQTQSTCPEECDWTGNVCSCKSPEKLICDGCQLDGKCYFKGTRLVTNSKESYCNLNNDWSVQKQDGVACQNAYECEVNICEKGQCGKYCEGCAASNGCFPFGTRFEGAKYCDTDKSIKQQKSEEDSCNNNYECVTNVCVNNQCISPSFIQKIIEWFKKLF